MCTHISSIQIHLSSSPQSSNRNVQVDLLADGHKFMSAVHDINLKPVRDPSAAGARPKEAESMAILSPTALPKVLDCGASDDTLRGPFSSQSHLFSQARTHTEIASPGSPRVDAAAANTVSSNLGGSSGQILDQERCCRCSSSNSSALNPSSLAESSLSTTSSSNDDDCSQIFGQARYNSSNYSPDLPNTASFWPSENSTQMLSGHNEQSVSDCLPLCDTKEISTDDSPMSTSYDWANLPMNLFQYTPSSSYSGSNATADLPMDSFQPASSNSYNGPNTLADLPMDLFPAAPLSPQGASDSTADFQMEPLQRLSSNSHCRSKANADLPMDIFESASSSSHSGSSAIADLPIDVFRPVSSKSHGALNTTPKDGLEKNVLPKNDPVASSGCHSPRSRVSRKPQTHMRLDTRRMKKLDGLLEMLYNASLPDVTEHNEIVSELRQLCRKGLFDHRQVASGSFPADPEEPIASSSAARFGYDLLSWEKYRQEEKRLIREEDLSSISASKEVNARMVKARRRHSKTRDWASDGRKAAKMFFDALHDRGAADRSYALLLLASNVSLDQMLKIAHFPALRSSFTSRFARLILEKAEGWGMMSSNEFTVLDVAPIIRH